jgi:rhodanese-related sulfurtransferase
MTICKKINLNTAHNKVGSYPWLFNKNITLKILFFITLFIFMSGLTAVAGAKGLETISPERTHKLIQAKIDNPDFIIIDIRTQVEFESGHIENAKLIDYYSKNFLKNMEKLDKNKTYLIYCRSANRSTRTLSLIKDMGFTSLYNMEKGINGWIKNGYKIVK